MDEGSLTEAKKRWRLVLGSAGEQGSPLSEVSLTDEEMMLDAALSAIYDETADPSASLGSGRAGSGAHSLRLARWLSDVRGLFSDDLVSVIQADAIERRGLRQLLLEPETLASIKPDVSIAAVLMSMKDLIPAKAKDSAREVVRKVVDELMRSFADETRRAVTGAINKSAHTPLPSLSGLDHKRTIMRNLKNYDPGRGRLLAEKFYFFERRRKSREWKVIVDMDQSGSMAESVVYASVFAAIFASLPSLDTHVIAFDTQVSDLSDLCRQDPVDLLFGVQLGGGTDINKSVAYCAGLIENPAKTLFILISDLYEGGVEAGLLRRLEEMHASGVKCLVLLALSDSGRPSFDERLARRISALGIACFACAPARLPELVEAALKGKDLTRFQSTAAQ